MECYFCFLGFAPFSAPIFFFLSCVVVEEGGRLVRRRPGVRAWVRPLIVSRFENIVCRALYFFRFIPTLALCLFRNIHGSPLGKKKWAHSTPQNKL